MGAGAGGEHVGDLRLRALWDTYPGHGHRVTPPHRLPSTPRGGGRWSRVAWPAACLLALLFRSSATDSSLRQAGIWHEGPPVLHGSDPPSVHQPLHQQPRGPRVPQSLHPRSLLVQPLLCSAPASLCAVCVRVVGSAVPEDVHILSQSLSGPPTLPPPRPRCPGVCPWPELTRSPESRASRRHQSLCPAPAADRASALGCPSAAHRSFICMQRPDWLATRCPAFQLPTQWMGQGLYWLLPLSRALPQPIFAVGAREQGTTADLFRPARGSPEAEARIRHPAPREA